MYKIFNVNRMPPCDVSKEDISIHHEVPCTSEPPTVLVFPGTLFLSILGFA